MGRGTNIFFSTILLLIFLPIMGGISLAILCTMRRPILFRQKRPGLKGKPFTMYKFRTMRIEKDGKTQNDHARITKLGAFLRKTSLDELPELLNVLKGEMSLVGPRPLLMEYVPRYNAHQRRRMEVLPGITGWAQVKGRNLLSWGEKFDMDVWYVDNKSTWLDAKILFKTVTSVLSQKNISQDGFVGAEKFKGNKE
jgi:lipopolysaccharide/colanic/teichoic acid biosynthesis glycosyltransferase